MIIPLLALKFYGIVSRDNLHFRRSIPEFFSFFPEVSAVSMVPPALRSEVVQ